VGFKQKPDLNYTITSTNNYFRNHNYTFLYVKFDGKSFIFSLNTNKYTLIDIKQIFREEKLNRILK